MVKKLSITMIFSLLFLAAVVVLVLSFDHSDFAYYMKRIEYGDQIDLGSSTLFLGEGFYFLNKDVDDEKYVVLNRKMPEARFFIDGNRNLDLNSMLEDGVVSVFRSDGQCVFYIDSDESGAVIGEYNGLTFLIATEVRDKLDWGAACNLFRE